MAQNYEVHIDGKPFIIGERPEFAAMPSGWLVIRVDRAEELPHLVEVLTTRSEIFGIYTFHADKEELWGWFKRNYRFVQAAGGAVTDEHGRLLAIHRMDRWDLPKGKVEPDEAIEEAALREVQEECGLRHLQMAGPLCHTWHTYERKGRQHLKRTDWFLMNAHASENLTPQSEEDIDDVRWMDGAGVEELRRDTYPSLLLVINAWQAARRDQA